MREIPLPPEKFGMSYPKYPKDKLYNGGIHPIEAVDVAALLLNGESTNFYVLTYNDMTIDSKKEQLFHTILRRKDGKFTKVSIKNYRDFYKLLDVNAITLVPDSIEALFAETKFADSEDAVDSLDELFESDMSKYYEKDSILNEPQERVILYVDESRNFYRAIFHKPVGIVSSQLLKDDEVLKCFEEGILSLWKMTSQEVLVPLTSEEADSIVEAHLKRTENKTYAMLYVGPRGNIYLNIPFVLDRVDLESLQEPLDIDMILSVFEHANVIWVKFGVDGVLRDASESDIEAIISYLNTICEIESTVLSSNVYSYTVGSKQNENEKTFINRKA